MDILPFEYIKLSYFWPKSAKKSFFVWGVSKKLKKLKKIEKNFWFFFHKTNSYYHIWIVPTPGVPQITLEGSRDQNLWGWGGALSAPLCKVRLTEAWQTLDFWNTLINKQTALILELLLQLEMSMNL